MVLTPKEYIAQNVGSWLLSDPEYQGKFDVISSAVKTSDHLDGFMSTIFLCDVVLQAKTDEQWVNNCIDNAIQ